MNPLSRLLDVESRLTESSISVDQALAELTTGAKPWHTAWWKEQRAARIGSECVTCGSTTPPLVLQHTWQPAKWKEALDRVEPPNWEWWKERHPLPPIPTHECPVINRRVCPHCGSIRVSQRKKRGGWACDAGQSGAPHELHADYYSPEPKIESRPDRKKNAQMKRDTWAAHQILITNRWQAWRESAECAEHQLRALRLSIEDSKRYLSFQDTKTLCRPCAAREDYQHIARSEYLSDDFDVAELTLWTEDR